MKNWLSAAIRAGLGLIVAIVTILVYVGYTHVAAEWSDYKIMKVIILHNIQIGKISYPPPAVPAAQPQATTPAPTEPPKKP